LEMNHPPLIQLIQQLQQILNIHNNSRRLQQIYKNGQNVLLIWGFLLFG